MIKYIVILFFFINSNVTAQFRPVYDSSFVTVKIISKDTINKYRSQDAFQYSTKDKARTKSFFERLWDWLWEKYYDLMGQEAGNTLITILLWTFAILGVVYFILRIIGMDAFAFFQKKNKDGGLSYEVLDENVHTINFNEAIETAVNQRNYRLAVRLLYLQTLKKLTDKNYINWQPNKSNRQYVHELANISLTTSFGSLTTEFEYVWYGEMQLSPQEYDIISNHFKQFYNRL
ncbi:MAG: DUF4129 domain-containing protein [Sphingobacteriales bacterium]|nr:MAG: DUF4129 domain-containing protein [Sphingobacteriales bacterium]